MRIRADEIKMTSRIITRLLLFASALILLIGMALRSTPRIAKADEPLVDSRAVEGESQDASFRYLGAASCAASGCHSHADGTRTAPLGREYSLWMEQDPHSRAYATLFSQPSKKIVDRLQLKTPAHKSVECLSCHANPAKKDQLVQGHRHTIRDGVSCESCHGPGEKWIALHTRLEWKSLSTAQRADYGFRETSDLKKRAEACVQCHVGSPGRDVNHDLIAAGHPALHFELSAYLSKLPRHWSRDKDKLEHGAGFESKLWAIGQLISARAALDLLDHRAAETKIAWPEFAEYDCFACHQDLDHDTSDGPGVLSWGGWHMSLLKLAKPRPDALLAEVQRLKTLMKSPYVSVDRKEVAKVATALRPLLDAASNERAKQQFSIADLQRQLIEVLTVGADDAQPDGGIRKSLKWDEAAQRFLAAAALRQALVDAHQAADKPLPKAIQDAEERLSRIREMLVFPESFASPQGFRSDKRDERVKTLFREIKASLPPN